MVNTNNSTRGIAILTFATFILQIFSPLIPQSYALNTAYYVSFGAGNDADDGRSSATPWQTLANVNASVFSEGDSINFNCGDAWSEELILQHSGIEGNPITYGKYGTCDGTNDPIIEGNAGRTISESGSVSYVTVRNIQSSGGILTLTGVALSATGIVFEDMSFSNPGQICVTQDSDKYVVFSGSTFDNCDQSIMVGNTGALVLIGNAFSSGGNLTNVDSIGAEIYASLNTFSNMASSALSFTNNSVIDRNTFTNICTTLGVSCSALSNSGNSIQSAIIQNNYIANIGSGILSSGYLDAIRLDGSALVSGVILMHNTISNAQVGIHLIDASNMNISLNTIFNTRAEAVVVEEVMADTTTNNTLSNNTFLTYNPDYSMIKIQDTVDASGTLAVFSNNSYINVYKPKLPVIDILTTGGDSYSLDKDQLTLLDLGATNFTYFGYKNYTSTGSYSGANLITNSTFTSDVTNWTGDNMTLTHDSTGLTLHASQGVTSTGVISSNSFSLVSGGIYEVSGTLKNLTQSGGSHVSIHLRQDIGPQTLYADRVIDVVSTASGKTFSSYITANADVSDARIDLEFSNPGEDIELDTVVVRRVKNLTRNARTNEGLLMINTGSTSGDFSCPGGGGCPSQYGSITNSTINFPLTIPAFSSQIILWRDPDINISNPFTILRPPTGVLSSNFTSMYDNTPITLSWTGSVAGSIITIRGETLTGSFTHMTSEQTGSLTGIIPPFGVVNAYYIDVTNDIGTFTDHIDVASNNQPPILDPANFFGQEDSSSITGTLTATDTTTPANQITYNYLAGSLTNGVFLAFNNSDGTFDFLPNENFCGQVTFAYIAKDFPQYTQSSEGTAYINVACTNDDPVAIDDSFTATGGVSNLLDALINEQDIDSPYETQTFFLTGYTLPSHGTLSVTGNLFDYVPDAVYVGPDSFTYSMMDQSGGLSNTGTITLNVIPGSNLPPLVVGDSYSPEEDTPFTATLSGYDLNPGDVLSFSAVTLPTHGVVSIVGTDFTYTPDVDYNGADSFTFIADDTALTSSSATINLTVTGIPDIPVALDDTIGVEMSADVILNVMVNDTDADSPYIPQNLTITGYTLPSHGTLTLVGADLHYTSDTPYLGSDSFTYTIVDVDGNISNTVTVNLNISSTNTAPIAYSGAFVTNEDESLVGTLSGYDADATPLTFIANMGATNGTLSVGSTGGFIYTPNLNFYGTDSFNFQVSDGVFTSPTETVSITINPINDAPIVGNDSGTGTEDATLILTGLLANDTDVDVGDTLSLASILVQGTKGIASLSGTTDVVYIPTPNACGIDTFSYQTMDQSGSLSGSGNVMLHLICTNDAPTVSGSMYTMTGNVLVNSGIILTGGLAGSDIDLDVLDYTLGNSTANGLLSFNTGGSFIYTPNLGFTGSDSFDFSVTDGFIRTGTATVSITVLTNTFNTAPIVYSGAFVTNEDESLVGTLSGFDLEGTSLAFSLGSGTIHGSISISSTGGIVYIPTANYNGSDTFTFRASDGIFTSAYETGSITINTINDLPIATADSAIGIEDTNLIIPVLANDTDVDGIVASITGLTQPLTGGVLTIVGTGIELTPAANYCSLNPVTFTYTAVDNLGGNSVSATSSFTVSCVPDAPIALDDAQTSTEDTPFTILSLANDTDIDEGDTISVSSFTQPSTGGTVTSVVGGFQFTPTTNFCSASPITFSYRARDILGNLSNTGTVSLSITCVNDLPTTSDISYTMTGNVLSGALNILTVNLTGSDIEGSPLQYFLGSPISSGSVSISSTGVLSFIPSLGFVGSVTGTYIAFDGTNSGATSNIAICVTSPDLTVPLPSCAGATPVEIIPTTGNGGGGGGGGSSSSTSISLNSAPIHHNPSAGSSSSQSRMTVLGGSGVSSELLSQLMYGKIQGPQKTPNQETQTNSQMSTPYTELLNVITTVLDYSRELGMTSPENVDDIRFSGQDALRQITSSRNMTRSEKADALRASAERLSEYLSPKPYAREYKALRYVIRILKARESIIRDTIDTLSQFITNNTEDTYNSAPMDGLEGSIYSGTLNSAPITPIIPISVISGEIAR